MKKAILFSAGAALLGASTVVSAQPGFRIGATTNGNLEANDPRTGEDASRHDDYRVRLRAGERVRISLESEAFDPILQVFRAGETEHAIAENDDNGENLNSRLSFSAPADGEYVVRVTSFDPAGLGAYRLRGEGLPPLPAPVTEPSSTATTQWRVFSGALGESDPDNDGVHFDDYQLHLGAGEQIVVRVDSSAFDPIVQILNANNRGGEPLEFDDDTGAGTNALLGFEAEEAGDYIVRVTSFGSGGTGAYTLRIGN